LSLELADIVAARQIVNLESNDNNRTFTAQTCHTESFNFQRHLFWCLLENMKACLRDFQAAGHLAAVQIESTAAYEHSEELTSRALTQPSDLLLEKMRV